MKMKRTIFILVSLLGIESVSGSVPPEAGEIIPGVSVSRFRMEREGKTLTVEMSVDLTGLDVESNRAVLLTPRLVHGGDSLDLPAVGIYGCRRYYYYVRNGMGSISGTEETTFRASGKPDTISYKSSVAYADWMDGATLKFHRDDWGCCHEILAEYEGRLGRHREPFMPEPVYVCPAAEVRKTRSLSGSAYIDFPVDQTVIYPEYRRNTSELGKIEATIDSVRGDRDVSIVSVLLKGYASPESPYAHNRDLAKGRTEALKRHILQLYDFADSLIVTDHEPEDWAGLRRYVENSNISHRVEILDLIDSDMEPDAKEARIRHAYPEEYRFLLQHCYPALRHTDYLINYTIRSYTDVDEIRRMLRTSPGKLSLNEIFMAARTMPPGSDEFAEAFRIAAVLYPDDPTANLNAANAAMARGELPLARRHLEKSGETPEAVYARGVYAALSGEYGKAERYFTEAAGKGLDKAKETLVRLREVLSEE